METNARARKGPLIPSDYEILTASELLDHGLATFPTASIVVDRRVFGEDYKYASAMSEKHMASFFIKLLPSLDAGAIYLNDELSVYRTEVSGSWSKRVASDRRYKLSQYFRTDSGLEKVSQILEEGETSASLRRFRVKRRQEFAISDLPLSLLPLWGVPMLPSDYLWLARIQIRKLIRRLLALGSSSSKAIWGSVLVLLFSR